jgi:hypothetical protein
MFQSINLVTIYSIDLNEVDSVVEVVFLSGHSQTGINLLTIPAVDNVKIKHRI